MVDMVDEAVRYMDLGWHVFPVNGKIPATEHGVKDASNELRMASVWWQHFPDRGIALATGVPSGVWVLDLDGPVGQDSIKRLQDEHGALPETMTVRTPNGWHLFFTMPEAGDIRNSASKVAPGVDVRGTGGYVVLPPSTHPTGRRYEWHPGRGPDECRLTESPVALVQLAAERPDREPAEELPQTISAGTRNDRLASLAGSMRRRGASVDSIKAALHEENRTRCAPSLPGDEVDQIAESIGSYTPSKPNGRPASVARIELVDREMLLRVGRQKQQPIDSIATPWPAWNTMCRGAGGGRGLARAWHVIVGASSGAGKSLWATNLAAHAVRDGHNVCMISLEMSQPEVITRLLSVLHGEDVRALEHGDRFDMAVWEDAAGLLLESDGMFWINREPIHALDQIEAAIREYAEKGVRLAIVDYLQLAWSDTADTMYQQITEVSHTIRRLAVELGITTLGLSQVNRQSSAMKGTPSKEGLMGGSSLENDADQVVLLGHPKKTGSGYAIDAVLDKNRHGPQTAWGVELDVTTLRMREQMPDEVGSYAV